MRILKDLNRNPEFFCLLLIATQASASLFFAEKYFSEGGFRDLALAGACVSFVVAACFTYPHFQNNHGILYAPFLFVTGGQILLFSGRYTGYGWIGMCAAVLLILVGFWLVNPTIRLSAKLRGEDEEINRPFP